MTNDKAVRYEARKWREASTGTREERDQHTGEWRDVPVQHPAEWAVYATDSGVRIAYADSEDAARKTAERWNAGKIPEKMLAKADSAKELKHILKPGDTVYTILRNVSRSGMNRRISLVVGQGANVKDITFDAARVMDENVKQRAGYVQDVGLSVGGCGMDMGFSVVYNLSRVLFPDGFVCSGEGCVSNDHFNDHGKIMRRENYKGKMHKGDGGYALKQRWL